MDIYPPWMSVIFVDTYQILMVCKSGIHAPLVYPTRSLNVIHYRVLNRNIWLVLHPRPNGRLEETERFLLF